MPKLNATEGGETQRLTKKKDNKEKEKEKKRKEKRRLKSSVLYTVERKGRQPSSRRQRHLMPRCPQFAETSTRSHATGRRRVNSVFPGSRHRKSCENSYSPPLSVCRRFRAVRDGRGSTKRWLSNPAVSSRVTLCTMTLPFDRAQTHIRMMLQGQCIFVVSPQAKKKLVN